MSQHWNGHWIEENYKPSRLGNWEVPNWHPEWPDRHCQTTTFQSENNGHLLTNLKKTNRSRENFISTWLLPKKIDRRLAEELSAPPKYQKQMWEAHKARHRARCGITTSSKSQDKNSESKILRTISNDIEIQSFNSKFGSRCGCLEVEEKEDIGCSFHQTCKI